MYDATNRMVEGTNWKGDKSAYTYNGLGLRVNNLVTTHAGKTYDRDYVIDYTSPENDDLYVYAMGNGQLEYEQRHVYAGSERLEQITEKGTGNWERTLYVHEDVMGNTRYYTKATGQTFAEQQYDAWGQPVSPSKLVNNDHGNYVFATFTGHIYDPILDIYFAEARFYDATNRTWMAMDPIKDGLNWYQYCLSNPIGFIDRNGKVSVHLDDGIGEGEPGYAYITLYEESYSAYLVLTAADVVAFGVPGLINTLDYSTSNDEYSTLFSLTDLPDIANSFGPLLGDGIGTGLEKAADKITSFPKLKAATKMTGNFISEAASSAGNIITIVTVTSAHKVQDDHFILTMMEDLNWIIQTGETEYVVDVGHSTTKEEQERLFNQMVSVVQDSYSFMEQPIADFFHNNANTVKSDYEIYLEIKDLPFKQRIARLNEYIKFYSDRLTAQYTYNQRTITEAERQHINSLVRQYAFRLSKVSTRYKEVLSAFEKFVCG